MAGKKILIVEDEWIIAEDLKRKLIHLGYDVSDIAVSAEAAVEKAGRHMPDLVLMDIMLRGSADGIEAAERISDQFNMPIVYVTAHADKKTLERAKITEPFGYILKPYEDRTLLSIIEMALYKHKMEKRLKADEELYRTVVEGIGQPVFIVNGEGRLLFSNGKAAQILGWTVGEGAEKNLEDFLTPDRAAWHMHHVRSVLQSGASSRNESEEVIRGVKKWLVTHLYPLKNGPKNPDRVLAIVNDITERKRAEEELLSLTKELQRSNAELQQFAYAVSHDLQEPLRTVASFIDLLAQKNAGKLDAVSDQYIQFTVDAVKRMQKQVVDLLVYSQVGMRRTPFEPTDLSEVLRSVMASLKKAIKDSGTVITCGSLPCVSADKSQMIQLFQNLIENSIKFRGKRKPEIHVTAEEQTGEWLFSFQDNGIGLDPQNSERIFVVFQRLHGIDEFPGTGIGLAICRKIVERHGGRIWVNSVQGEGATFYFTLPEGAKP